MPSLGYPASEIPLVAERTAVRTPFGVLLPPGGRVAAYVGSQTDANDFYADGRLLVSTLNAGLARCRPGGNDYVIVKDGHSENISSADQMSNLVAGTRIVAEGNCTFTFTATAASFLVDVDDVKLIGLKFDCTGVDNLVAPMTVTGARCSITDCEFILQDGSNGALKGVELSGTAADGFVFARNKMLSADQADPLTSGALVIAGASDNIEVVGNYISAASPGDTVGLIDVTAAATNLRIYENDLLQLESTNAADALIIDNVAATGMVSKNRIRLSENNAPASSGVSIGASADIGLFDNLVTAANASGALSPAADT